MSPVENPLEGQPIGNGRMATSVWTTSEAVHFQINRTDVRAVSKNHRGGSIMGNTDYSGGCAWVTLEPGDQPFHGGNGFEQKLSVYEAECSIVACEVRVRCFVSAVKDVLVIEVDDQREEPHALRVTLSMWRPSEVQTGDHKACYKFHRSDGTIAVKQSFDEQDYHCASAVAASIPGCQTPVESSDERSLSLVTPTHRGKTLILVSSAAAIGIEGDQIYPWLPQKDVLAVSQSLLEKSAGEAYDNLRREHDLWWANFWSHSFVHLRSRDGLADFMERVRNLHLYYMAISSRGLLPPLAQGMLFGSGGDKRMWGSQFWLWDTELLYYPLFAADADDLLAPYFHMYRGQLPACEEAARQRWGVDGAFYPETAPFDGPIRLPEDVAQEFQDVFLGRKRDMDLSERARKFTRFESHLSTLSVGIEHPEGMVDGRFTFISHILSSGCELATQAWWRYRYSGDREWLKMGAYPMLRSTVEFYRNYAQKGADGRYHIHDTNVHERFWGVRDGIMDLAAIRGTIPLAIQAAEILDLDTELRSKWQECLDHLAAYPLGHEPEAQAITGGLPAEWGKGAIDDLTGGALADDTWAAGYLGAAHSSYNYEQVWLTPVFPFEDYTLETQDETMSRMAQRTYDFLPDRQARLEGKTALIWGRIPIFTARLGRGDELPAILASHYSQQHVGILANGFGLWQGEQAPSIEHMAGISTAVQDALIQSLSPRPGDPEIIHVFPACPKSWDATFSL